MKRYYALGVTVLLLGAVGALGAYSYHSAAKSESKLATTGLSTDYDSTFSTNYWQHALDDTLGLFSTSTPDYWLWEDPLNDPVEPPFIRREDPFYWDFDQEPWAAAEHWQDSLGHFGAASSDPWLWDDPFKQNHRPPLARQEAPFGWEDFLAPSPPTKIDDSLAAAPSPPAEIDEREDAFIVRLAVPTIAENSIEVLVEGEQRLRIVAATKAAQPQAATQQASGDFTERFERTLSLPGPVDAQQVESEYSDGVLRLKVPKARHS